MCEEMWRNAEKCGEMRGSAEKHGGSAEKCGEVWRNVAGLGDVWQDHDKL